MPLFRALTLLLLVALAGCATVGAPPRADFYVMRHLQKGDGPDPGLSQEGRANAERLARWFGQEKLRAIFVSATRRGRETAAPAAAMWKLVPKEYDPSDTPGVVARALVEKGPVLIVGHSNTVPDIVERLDSDRPAPLAETDFGDIWFVTRAGHRTSKHSLIEMDAALP